MTKFYAPLFLRLKEVYGRWDDRRYRTVHIVRFR